MLGPVRMSNALILFVLVGVLAGGAAARAGANPVDYARDVKPVFAHRCTACHGALKQRAGLRVDAAALLLKGGVHGAVVVPAGLTRAGSCTRSRGPTA
jgi:mono/diheme cytochrome c family protein